MNGIIEIKVDRNYRNLLHIKRRSHFCRKEFPYTSDDQKTIEKVEESHISGEIHP